MNDTSEISATKKNRVDFKVRDYELDAQGIVNNSVYGNYLEHARHEFLIEQKIDFVGLAQKGIHLVVTKLEINYKHPLKSGDDFYVVTEPKISSRIKFQFIQNIYKAEGDTHCVSAVVTGVGMNVNTGRPIKPDSFNLFL